MINSSATIYRVETKFPKLATLYTFQGSNAKRDSIRFANKYKNDTGVDCYVRREKHMAGSTVFRTA